MDRITPLWQFPHSGLTSMNKQPPPDELVQEAQELAQAYRRVEARRYGRLLSMRLSELIADYGLSEVQYELARIERNMALSVSTAGDPRR